MKVSTVFAPFIRGETVRRLRGPARFYGAAAIQVAPGHKRIDSVGCRVDAVELGADGENNRRNRRLLKEGAANDLQQFVVGRRVCIGAGVAGTVLEESITALTLAT